MSDILIKGMEMPKGRPVCIVIDAAGQARRYDLNNDRYADDKLFEAVPVPPHGDLIDRDKLEKDIDKYIGGEESRSRFHHWVQVQDAVIPMDKGEEK